MARAMKDSGIEWIGEIPEGWSICKQKHLIKLINGRAYSDDEFETDGTYRILRVGNLFSNPVWYTSSMELEPEKYCEKGDLLYAWSMSYAPFIWNGEKVIYHYHIWKTVLSERIERNFCYYYYMALTDAIMAEKHETTMSFITMGVMNNSYIAFPSLSEQKRIADFLDRRCAEIDRVIADTEKTIEEYKALKQSIITEAVTKGIRPGRKMKDSGIEWIGEIPEEWVYSRFKFVAQVKANLVEPDGYGDYPQVSPENIEKGSGQLLPCKTVAEVGVISGNHLFHQGQILYSKIRPKLNKITIAPFDGLCSADMYPIETTQNAQFMLYAMLSDVLLAQVAKITEDRVKMPKINQDELGNTWFAIPPSSEQEQIVLYLDDMCDRINCLITEKQKLLSELDSYKKSVIYEYVTGKKEVPACL